MLQGLEPGILESQSYGSSAYGLGDLNLSFFIAATQ